MSPGGNIKRGAFTIALGTLVTRILGLIRDITIAALFNRFFTDAFFVAFTIPNVLRYLVGEGAFTMAFVPVFTEVLNKDGEKEGRRFVGSVCGYLLIILLFLITIGIIFTPWIVKLYSYGFKSVPGKLEITAYLTRIMFPFLLFMSLSALSMGILNSLNHFATPAFAPVLLNISIIFCAFLLRAPLSKYGIPAITSLAIGVLIGGFLHLLIQVPPLIRKKYFILPNLSLSSHLKKMGKLLMPAIIGVSIYQIDILVSRLFASLLKEGSVTYLYYSIRLTELPQGIFIMAIATATLPTLSKLYAENNNKGLVEVYNATLKSSLFIAIPAAIGLFSLSLPIINVLFQRGKFTFTDSILTSHALYYLSPSIIFIAIVRQTTPLFYTLRDSKTPVKGSAINLIVYITTAYILMHYLEHKGIALGITLASMCHCGYFIIKIKQRIPELNLKSLLIFVLKVGLSAIIMGCCGKLLSSYLDWSISNSIKNGIILILIIIASIVVYFLIATILRLKEAEKILLLIKERFSKKSKK